MPNVSATPVGLASAQQWPRSDLHCPTLGPDLGLFAETPPGSADVLAKFGSGRTNLHTTAEAAPATAETAAADAETAAAAAAEAAQACRSCFGKC